MCLCSPVQLAKQTLGRSDQLNHGGQEFIGGLMGDFVVVGRVLPSLRHCAAQVVVSRSHLPHQSLQVVRLHAVVLPKIQKRQSLHLMHNIQESYMLKMHFVEVLEAVKLMLLP